MLQVGDTVPEFSLPNQDGTMISPADFKGKKIVIYFYPKDNTPGCTTEACGFRDVYDEILAKGAVVLGISKDSTASHTKFREKFELPFHLLSDVETTTIQAFGAWGEKKMCGKTYMGIIRSTFVVDENGVISHVFPKVNTKTHPAEILAAL